MSEYYGPALPPGSAPPGGVRGEDRVTGTELPENTTRDKQACNEVEVTAKGNESTCNERPSKPTNSANTYGPTLPPDMRVNIPEASATPSPRVPSLYGSALPPGMEQRPEHGEGSGKGGEGDTERGETAEGARDAKTNLAYEGSDLPYSGKVSREKTCIPVQNENFAETTFLDCSTIFCRGNFHGWFETAKKAKSFLPQNFSAHTAFDCLCRHSNMNFIHYHVLLY